MEDAQLYVTSQNCYLRTSSELIMIPSLLFVDASEPDFISKLTELFYTNNRSKGDKTYLSYDLLARTSIFRPNFPAYVCFSGFVRLFFQTELLYFSPCALLTSVAEVEQESLCDIAVLLGCFIAQIKYAFCLSTLSVVLPRISLHNIALFYYISDCQIMLYPNDSIYMDFDVKVHNGVVSPSPFAVVKEYVMYCAELVRMSQASNRPIACYFDYYSFELFNNQLSRYSLVTAFGLQHEFLSYLLSEQSEYYSFPALNGITYMYMYLFNQFANIKVCGEVAKFKANNDFCPQAEFLAARQTKDLIWVRNYSVQADHMRLDTTNLSRSPLVDSAGIYMHCKYEIYEAKCVCYTCNEDKIIGCF